MSYPNATKEQYIAALLKVRDKSHFSKNKFFLEFLRAQCQAENKTMTATQLANCVGHEKYGVANSNYGKLAHRVAEALGYTPDIRHNNNEPKWWMTLSSGNEASDDTIDGHFEFVMHDELYEALLEMKWCK